MAAGCRKARAGRRSPIDIPVGAMRAYEFVADEPGDWALHCHKSHHTMNAMGHSVRTFIGAQHRDLVKAIRRVASPDYMAMGSAGMAEMGEMEMPMPDNTLPMMTGFAQFGAARNGRHVHGGEGARGSRARRLQGSGLVQESARNRGL